MKKLFVLLALILIGFALFAQNKIIPDSIKTTEKLIPPIPKPKLPIFNVEEELFQLVAEMPCFPGCENEVDKKERYSCAKEKLYKYIYEKLEYPSNARKHSLEGKVYIAFIVDKTGQITQPVIRKDIGGNCGLAALEVFETMIEENIIWSPGKHRGEPVLVEYNVQVEFKL